MSDASKIAFDPIPVGKPDAKPTEKKKEPEAKSEFVGPPAPAAPPKLGSRTAWVAEVLRLATAPTKSKKVVAAGLLSLVGGAGLASLMIPTKRPPTTQPADGSKDVAKAELPALPPPPTVEPPKIEPPVQPVNLNIPDPQPGADKPIQLPQPILAEPVKPTDTLPPTTLFDPEKSASNGPLPPPVGKQDPMVRLTGGPDVALPVIDLSKVNLPVQPPAGDGGFKLPEVKIEPPMIVVPPSIPAPVIPPPTPAPTVLPVQQPPVQQPPTKPAFEPSPPKIDAPKLTDLPKPVEVPPPQPAKPLELLPPVTARPADPPAVLPPVVVRPTTPDPAITRASIASNAQTTFDVDLHDVRTGDTFASVSRKHLNDERYAEAIRLFNNGRSIAEMKTIEIPPIHILRQRFPQAIGGRPMDVVPASRQEPAANRGAFKTYTVPPGGITLKGIAKQAFGDEQQWVKVWDLNPKFKPSDPIAEDTVVKLPADARIGR